MACGFAASSLWLLGYPEQGLNAMRHGLTLAQTCKHPIALMHGHYFMAKIHHLRPRARRDARIVRSHAGTGG